MYLPEDIIRDILLRLPVKSLLRLTCICNSWRYLILSDQFIDSHTKLGRQMEIIVSSEIAFHRDMQFCISDQLTEPTYPRKNVIKSDLQSMSLCKIFQLEKNYEVIGHCNGIICLSWNHTTILLWNPALQQCRALPPIDFADGAGFCYDSCSQDYKVVITSSRLSRFMIYSLKNDSWKTIYCSYLNMKGYVINPFRVGGLFLEGRLYWLQIIRGRYFGLLVFDLAEEEFLEFDLSHTFNATDHDIALILGIFRGCVSLVLAPRAVEYGFEIWSMEDHCIPQSWTRIRVDNNSFLRMYSVYLWKSGLTRDGKVFAFKLEDDETHLLYNVETHEMDVHKRKLNETNRKLHRWYVISDFIQTLVAVIPKVTPKAFAERNLASV